MPASKKLSSCCDVIFASATQAYREVLLGCVLMRMVDGTKDIRLPYIDLGPNAFSGRSLDEKIVNPFLRSKGIPCSRGPYLSVFRRQVRFDLRTREGLRDKEGYDAFLALVDLATSETNEERLLSILRYVLYRFVLLREGARIDLVRLDRISLRQYHELISGLLSTPSGGLLPVILVLAMVETIIARFSLGWTVDFQGINVADSASGVPGDITVGENGLILLGIEVTERPVERSRLAATFTDKIAARGLSDYVFLVHLAQIADETKQQVDRYFAQGYDVNFVDIREWVVHNLVTVGVAGRRHFQDRILHHLSQEQIPKALRVSWNVEVEKLLR